MNEKFDNVLLKEYELNPKIKLSLIFSKIDELLKNKDTVNVAIDGYSGAGKSTLANLVKEKYDCNVFHMDDFFLTPELKTKERLSEVGGNVDYIRFHNEVILGLKSDKEFKFQKYNCQKMKLDEFVNVKPKKLNIIEGSYSMHPTLIENYDLKIFLPINKKEQVERILKRNGPFMLQKFINEWIPKENLYFEKMNISDKADIVFNA
jgi:uridine kinase